MSNRRSAATRRKELRERRRAATAEARRGWQDSEFGVSVRPRRDGRGRADVRWTVDRDPYVALMGLDRLRRGTLAGFEVALVAELRDAGVSWEDIGFALGVSGEAARQRLAVRVAGLATEEGPGAPLG